MALATCGRCRLPSFQLILKRTLSTKLASSSTSTSEISAQPAVQSHTTLPPAKMRALISLYHQADSWVTPENLMQRIDDAFVPERARVELHAGTPDRIDYLPRVSDMRKALQKAKNAPRMEQWDPSMKQSTYASGEVWSEARKKRELKIIEALYGVDATIPGQLSPGLEVLQESAESAKKNKLEDQEGGLDVQDLLRQG